MARVFRSDNPEYPRVKVTERALNAVGGNVSVDLDGINELLRDDLGLEKDITPKYVLYGSSENSPLLGLHFPYTHTAFVNLPSSQMNDGGPSSTLVHESVHLVDSVEHKIRTAGELALRYGATVASVRAGREVAAVVPGPLITDAMLNWWTMWQLRMGIYYRHLDPSENRARRAQDDRDLMEKYRNVVSIGRWSIGMYR